MAVVIASHYGSSAWLKSPTAELGLQILTPTNPQWESAAQTSAPKQSSPDTLSGSKAERTEPELASAPDSVG